MAFDLLFYRNMPFPGDKDGRVGEQILIRLMSTPNPCDCQKGISTMAEQLLFFFFNLL